ncbi:MULTISPECIES: tRNA1(Val) (adenine(37)-N6)-methyltransferase [Aerococcus]|uniref:tRNA1(Val) (Adenine(37)-N6)-methyltransferase n=1 Tax=Aerococcus tenax TaxID=3078812 RepID=A0A5N1BCX6_9LACT|nr:tRNA1(Val) (adenine(37)-N6)-methyltransferase [Aerococcus urinae]KAA9237825.1 tRNA1(Val) (adenine(37)-N6)-methyltransferase [Aerococcus urinae]MDK6596915.1 tRNA1(Val) (adenine(37)-N6)-methyltransferase [Aerococcus urinae]MDK7801288.1 tRNA1(Val) (adenine(37)-N6)-methyltransferase [Aerococcus urinae]MDK8655172.1 tRNA1(Val) (adenine(37)-N6)-methyltransferase [Aerococcus urinae]RAV70964.1 SAM-dependent methyltransferase [Aerococcus urinae]
MTLLANERIDQLSQFDRKIIQSDDTFSLSTDALFLAYFARVRKTKKQKIVDFCSGNGAIPLILSAMTDAPIEAIEIQPELADMARRSVALNHLEEQITIHTGNIKSATSLVKPESVNVITCNPPYFKVYPDSWINPNDKKALARHEIAMTLEDIFKQSQALLKERGRLVLVHRPERLTEMIQAGLKYRLIPKRLRFVHPKPDKPANTLLIDFMKQGQEKGLQVLPPLYVYTKDNVYTEEVKAYLHQG